MTYTDAIELLKKNNDNFQYKVEWVSIPTTKHERYLTEQISKKPVFVTDYPKEIKAFYMRQNEDGKTVAAADMLVPGIGELIGSQREERLDGAGSPHEGGRIPPTTTGILTCAVMAVSSTPVTAWALNAC